MIPTDLAELVLILSLRHLARASDPAPGVAKTLLDALPFAAAPWIRITAHNHLPTCSIDALAASPQPPLNVIQTYLQHTAHTPGHPSHYCRVSHVATDSASQHGHTQLLDLLLHHLGPTAMPYSTRAMDLASAKGHVHVLAWWLASPVRPLKYTHHALTDAALGARMPVLDWWQASGLVCLYDVFRVLRHASRHVHIDVLRWFHAFLQGNLYCPPGVMEDAAARGHVAVLEWWTHKSHVPLLYKHAMDAATKARQVHVLQWFVDRGPRPLLFSAQAVQDVARNRGPEEPVVAWWYRSGLLSSICVPEE